MDLGPLLLFIAGLWLLRGLARSVTEGDPFGAPNVQRLRRLGFLLVAGGPAVEVLNTLLREALFNSLPPHPAVDIGMAGYNLPGTAILAGLGAFILAEVFAHGVRCARTSRARCDMPADPPPHRIAVHLDRLLDARGMTLTELAERVDVTVVNLSILKNGRARAIRFSTLTAICEALDCQPGELLGYQEA